MDSTKRRSLAVWVGVSLLACTPTVDFPVTFDVDPEFSEKETCLIEEAARRWEEAAPGLIRFEFEPWRGNENPSILRCDGLCDPGDSEKALGYCDAIAGGNLWVHTARVVRHAERRELPYEGVFTAVVMHELGHHMGLYHIAPYALMRPSAREPFHPCVSRADLTALYFAYGRRFEVPECELLSSTCEGLSE